MSETVKLVNPEQIQRNPENPRLIFRQEELDALQDSIKQQGILVPLTVYSDGKFYILDGERRWRCALKLGMTAVPIIIQPKPNRMQNLMMMFAIHHRRDDWDPLPTALKLQILEDLFMEQQGKRPTESQLAELASLTRGEVRRLKKLLNLPQEYRDELLDELNKPRSQQVITVDHILEATNAATALRKRNIIAHEDEDILRKVIIEKFRTKVISNTVAPRKLARLAQAVERGQVPLAEAKIEVHKLIVDPRYSIEMVFEEAVEQVDFQHSFEQLVDRLSIRVNDYQERGYRAPPHIIVSLTELRSRIDTILGALNVSP